MNEAAAVLSFIFILGLALGSYVNSWAWRHFGLAQGATPSATEGWRVHEGKWRWVGRSQCVHCARRLSWRENIPLVSFLLLRGRCHACRGLIPRDYFWVELDSALLFLAVAWFHSQAPVLNLWLVWRDLVFTALLIAVFVYDYKYQLILTGLTWAGTALALGINILALGISPYNLLLGMAVGGGFFLAQYLVSRGRWVGGGDVRLGVMLGALLGWPGILLCLFLAYVIGALVAIPLLLLGKKSWKSEIPFATFLAMGAFVSLLWGQTIWNWYLGFLK